MSEPKITIGEAIRQAVRTLSQRSTTPRLDAEVLLAHTLELGRASLLAHTDDYMAIDKQAQFEAFISRRAVGEPVAYLTGHKEFYGLDLFVTPEVLIPRPETEHAVDACLELLPSGQASRLADIGTGSGAILVAVTVSRPHLTAYGTDISQGAIAVAQRNCELHKVSERVKLYVGNLLEPLEERVNMIVANLPYVPPGEAAPDVAAWEPQMALFGGGEDGTALIREFLAMAPRYLLPGGSVIMEVAYSQGNITADMAQVAFPGSAVEVRKDLAGLDRIVVLRT